MLAVTALAANTSLGDAVTAAAAARAGLSRPSEIEGAVMTEMDGSTPLAGHVVSTVRGFEGFARLLALALPPLQALIEDGEVPLQEEVGLFLALPRSAATETRTAGQTEAARLVERLVAATKLRVSANASRNFASGHAAFGMAVQAALASVARREVRICLLGAIDSLCDRRALVALETDGRLKTADTPVGLQPGEAATFLVAVGASDARKLERPPLARISGAGVAMEPRAEDAPPQGRGMLRALENLVQGTGPLVAGGTSFVLDCNGEAWRAADWGACQQRLTATMPGVVGAVPWFPAASFGDAGAASAGLGAQMAIRAVVRQHLPGPCAVVLGSSDDGARSAIRIEKAV